MANLIARAVDGIVETFSPTAGERRAASRARRELQTRMTAKPVALGFESARPRLRDRISRLLTGGSVNALLQKDLRPMVGSTRDLIRNHPFATSANLALAQALVRTGIDPKPKIEDPQLLQLVLDTWKDWAKRCGVDGSSWTANQQTGAMEFYAGGEFFVRAHFLTAAEARAYKSKLRFKIQLLPAEQLTTDSWTEGNGERVILGKQLDRLGAPKAYHFFTHSPSDPLTTSERVPVPAEQVGHVFKRNQAGQERGVPILQNVIFRLRDLDEFLDASLTQAKVATLFGMVLEVEKDMESEEPSGTVPGASGGGQIGVQEQEGTDDQMAVERLEPGSVTELLPGQKAKFPQPPQAGGTETFVKQSLMAVSAATTVPYPVLTHDFTGYNYASFRGANLQFDDHIASTQWGVFIPGMCDFVWEIFCRQGKLAGLWDEDYFPVSWGVERPKSIDPVKDAEASTAEMNATLSTFEDVRADRGEDWKETIDKVAQIRDYAATKGLGPQFTPGGFGARTPSAPAGARPVTSNDNDDQE